jgi:sulfate adenylyltransferase
VLIEPYGGALVDLMAAGEERDHLLRRAAELPSVLLSPRSLADLELMATGGLSPLDRFLGRADYGSVLENMRLANGAVYPIPVTLPVGNAPSMEGKEITLRSANNERIAVMRVEEVFEWDRDREARLVYGAGAGRHPLVAEMSSWPRWYASGPIRVLNLPRHHDFPVLRRTPAIVRQLLAEAGNPRVVAFHVRSPMHRAHEELTRRAAEGARASLLIHPAVGMTRHGDADHYTRVRTYLALLEKYFDPASTLLALAPLATRLAGPREALWHGIVRRNYGASHFIVGRDHASPAEGSFYGPYEAQELFARFEREIGVALVASREIVYLPDDGRYAEESEPPVGVKKLRVSAAEVHEGYLAKGRDLPSWLTRPEVADILARAYPPTDRQGFCIWFTGLPSAGKSTIAEILSVMLMENGRQVTLLDGDVVRTHLSKGLGFSKEDRDTNILRIGFVASEIARHNGVAICAAVSPYRATRDQVRNMVGAGKFVEVYAATPIEICEERDVKGYYARARAGEIRGFTGVDDPYEPPPAPEITLTTHDCQPPENARKVIAYLKSRGFLKG